MDVARAHGAAIPVKRRRQATTFGRTYASLPPLPRALSSWTLFSITVCIVGMTPTHPPRGGTMAFFYFPCLSRANLSTTFFFSFSLHLCWCAGMCLDVVARWQRALSACMPFAFSFTGDMPWRWCNTAFPLIPLWRQAGVAGKNTLAAFWWWRGGTGHGGWQP